MDTLKMKSNADTGSTPPPARGPESDRPPVGSDHPPPPAKLPSWRPTLPGVQPRPTLHGVQPLITLRGLSAPTEHDLPVRRDTPQDPVEAPFEGIRFGAPRVPTDFGLDLDPVDFDRTSSERFEDPAPSSRDSRSSRAPLNFERAKRVRRWGLGIAIALGSFAFVLAVLLLFASPARQQRVSRAPSRVELPASTAPSLGKSEIAPPPPVLEHLAPPPSELPPPLEPDGTALAPSPPEAAPSIGREVPAPLAKADAPKPTPAATAPSRTGLFSQVPVRPGTN